eukprot:3294882-Prymnesium_polylepis.1
MLAPAACIASRSRTTAGASISCCTHLRARTQPASSSTTPPRKRCRADAREARGRRRVACGSREATW